MVLSNKKGGFAVESLFFLVTVVFTSAVIFFLVQSGVVAVESDGSSTDDFLNADFLPIAMSDGTLVVQDFKLCSSSAVRERRCVVEQERFVGGDEVHFSFTVISSTYLDEIQINQNYRLFGPNANLLLDALDEDTISYEDGSELGQEVIYFHDYFILADSAETGQYQLDLIIENPLILKEVILARDFYVD